MDAVGLVADSFEKQLVAQADLSRTPIGGTFELLPACNLKCRMCYIRQSWKEVQEKGGLRGVEFWERVICEAIDQGLLYVLFTGGEPFLYPDFRILYEKVSKMPVYIVINTNATLLDEDTVRWLADHKPRRINISLYGASNETYYNLCGLKDGFDRVLNAFSLLKKYQIPFRVHSVLVPDNVHDYDGIVRICNEYEVPLQMTSYMFPPHRREKLVDYDSHRLPEEEAAKISFRYMKDSCGDIERFRQYKNQKLQEIQFPEKSVLFGCDRMACRGGVSSFWVNWKGQVSACGIMDQKAVDLQKYSFADAWEQVKEFHDHTKLSGTCAVCEKRNICPVCAAAAYCETGQLDGVPQYCCRYCEEYVKLLKAGE